MPPKAARRGRRVADSDDEDEEMAPAAPAPSAPRADDDEDMDEAEEDVPADGDRMDRYQQNQLREERKFAAAIQSEKVVESAPSGARPLPSGNSNDRWERESDTSMESDDEVLEELDVFINQSLASRLYVLQYPLRQGADPFPDENRPESGRIKPMSRMVELNVPLDTTSENYDRWKGQELADGANDPNIVTKYGQRLIDTQVHSSTPVPISATYFVGVVKGAALHLTPVNKIVQMRPNLAYLNKPKEKPAGSKGDGDDSPTSSRIMQMSMRKTEGAESREENARKMAENAERKRAEEEPWTSLSILPPTSAEAETEREGLIGNELDYDEAQMQGNSATYLDEVAPRTTTSSGRYYQDSKDDFKVLKGLSLAEIQGYPLPEQLKCLMINGGW